MSKKKKVDTRKTTPCRDVLISAGYFDGRFRAKTYKDKKKESDKYACRSAL